MDLKMGILGGSKWGAEPKMGFFEGEMFQNGSFGVKMGGGAPKNGDFGAQIGGDTKNASV